MNSPEHQAVSVSRADLQSAVDDGLITSNQSEQLWGHWSLKKKMEAKLLTSVPTSPVAQTKNGPSFGFTNVLYYFGGFLAIGSMSIFITAAWSAFGAWGLFTFAIAYIAVALKASNVLQRRGLPTPAGIFATLAVFLVPLSLWALQSALGMWPPNGPSSFRAYHTTIDWRWVTLEFGTLAAGVAMLWRYRQPFMVMPIAVTIWYMSMDFAQLLMKQSEFSYTFTRDVSLFFGLVACLLAVWVDIRSRLAKGEWNQDFAYWLYMFGALMFWGGLSLQSSDSQLGKAIYALINIGMLFLGAGMGRRVFTVLGSIGFTGYLGYLSYNVFKDSLMFTFVLTFIGFGMIALGVWWQRNVQKIEARISQLLPEGLRPR